MPVPTSWSMARATSRCVPTRWRDALRHHPVVRRTGGLADTVCRLHVDDRGDAQPHRFPLDGPSRRPCSRVCCSRSWCFESKARWRELQRAAARARFLLAEGCGRLRRPLRATAHDKPAAAEVSGCGSWRCDHAPLSSCENRLYHRTSEPRARGADALIRRRMDVALLNMSHGTQAEHQAVIASHGRWPRSARRRAVLLGPVRAQDPPGGPCGRRGAGPGDAVTLTIDDQEGREWFSRSATARIVERAAPGDHLSLADGTVDLEVTAIAKTSLLAKVLRWHGDQPQGRQPAVSGGRSGLNDRQRQVDCRFGSRPASTGWLRWSWRPPFWSPRPGRALRRSLNGAGRTRPVLAAGPAWPCCRSIWCWPGRRCQGAGSAGQPGPARHAAATWCSGPRRHSRLACSCSAPFTSSSEARP